jgi:hypothetical protein
MPTQGSFCADLALATQVAEVQRLIRQHRLAGVSRAKPSRRRDASRGFLPDQNQSLLSDWQCSYHETNPITFVVWCQETILFCHHESDPKTIRSLLRNSCDRTDQCAGRSMEQVLGVWPSISFGHKEWNNNPAQQFIEVAEVA